MLLKKEFCIEYVQKLLLNNNSKVLEEFIKSSDKLDLLFDDSNSLYNLMFQNLNKYKAVLCTNLSIKKQNSIEKIILLVKTPAPKVLNKKIIILKKDFVTFKKTVSIVSVKLTYSYVIKNIKNDKNTIIIMPPLNIQNKEMLIKNTDDNSLKNILLLSMFLFI